MDQSLSMIQNVLVQSPRSVSCVSHCVSLLFIVFRVQNSNQLYKSFIESAPTMFKVMQYLWEHNLSFNEVTIKQGYSRCCDIRILCLINYIRINTNSVPSRPVRNFNVCRLTIECANGVASNDLCQTTAGIDMFFHMCHAALMNTFRCALWNKSVTNQSITLICW